MTDDKTTPEESGSWLMELFVVQPFTPEEQAEHDAIVKPLIAKQALSDAECRKRCNEILRGPDACPRCMGSGFVDHRNAGGICFKCNGVGFLRK